MWKQSEGNQHYYLGKYKVGANLHIVFKIN